MSAESGVGLDAILERGEAQLLDLGDGRLRERLVAYVRERRAPMLARELLWRSLGLGRLDPPPSWSS